MPRPGVAKPEHRKQVQRRGFRSTVYDSDAYKNILGRSLSVFNIHVKIAVIVEYTCVNQFIFGHAAPATAILLYQVSIGIFDLVIFIQVFHIAVSRSIVKVVVVFFNVFSMVAFWPGQAKEAFLQNRITPIPECRCETDLLVTVAYSRYSIFSPTIGPGACVIVGQVIPGGAMRAVVLAHSAPGALTHIGPPAFPVDGTLSRLDKSLVLCCRMCCL